MIVGASPVKIMNFLIATLLLFWQVAIHLTTLSLDILLYIAGKLNLAGPYAIRSSIIFGNCCKVVDFANMNIFACLPNFTTIQENTPEWCLFFKKKTKKLIFFNFFLIFIKHDLPLVQSLQSFLIMNIL